MKSFKDTTDRKANITLFGTDNTIIGFVTNSKVREIYMKRRTPKVDVTALLKERRT